MFVMEEQDQGPCQEAKGKIKEFTGDLVGDEKLATEGKIEKNLGKAQAKVRDVKQDFEALAQRAPRLAMEAGRGDGRRCGHDAPAWWLAAALPTGACRALARAFAQGPGLVRSQCSGTAQQCVGLRRGQFAWRQARSSRAAGP